MRSCREKRLIGSASKNIQHINQTSILLLADARYQGQAFEIELPLSIDWLKQEQNIHQLIEAFSQIASASIWS
ncbi:hypothetical protein BsIDN1_06340 [Bacillus safensis]|uniref:Uncharacterized protein n=1 Tax=Bacillus safensis TaxID=561879 RepID=A0A5S9M658_BACIA|nr:hypothetical protein BsIDN1_06340 [Bacillus safensis]